VPQEARPIPWMTPLQTVRAYLLWRGFGYTEAKRRALLALERLDLSKSCNDLNRKLSGGMRRKVMVATVLSSEADVIFLDEPTTGLDPISRREFWATLREIGRNVSPSSPLTTLRRLKSSVTESESWIKAG